MSDTIKICLICCITAVAICCINFAAEMRRLDIIESVLKNKQTKEKTFIKSIVQEYSI